MKRFCLALFLVLLAVEVHAQGGFVLEYKGMVFGREMADPHSMKKDHQQGDLVFYTRYGDGRTFQGVPLQDQFYGYAGGKLALVLFNAHGPSAYNALKSYFDAHYGQAMQPEMNVKRFVYGAGDVDIQLNYDESHKMAEVSYVYRPLFKQLAPGK